MAKVLITGTSGFVGSALARAMVSNHDVIAFSRRPTDIDGALCVQGVFHSFEDLRLLDEHKIDVCVHLAAVTGGCREEDGMLVNVEGTRRLMRYLIDRGCQRFVNASSIAVVGFQDLGFRPICLPIADDHPCLDRHGYGFSKALMERVTQYLWRQVEDIDVINIRLASIIPDDAHPQPKVPGPIGPWHLGGISLMFLSDAVRCFSMAAEASYRPGVRTLNAVGAHACVACPVPEVLRRWYGADAEHLDFSHYERPGHERDSVFRIEKIRDEIGFEPARDILSP